MIRIHKCVVVSKPFFASVHNNGVALYQLNRTDVNPHTHAHEAHMRLITRIISFAVASPSDLQRGRGFPFVS